MLITDIKEFKKGRYEIYLNDEFAFLLYKSEIDSLNIKKGHEISESTYDEIMKHVLPKRAKKRAMNLLIKNDLPEKKLREKLSEGKYPEICVNEAIEYVKSYHYIDDNRYAHNYIACKANSLSKNVIKNKLIEKGIDKAIIENELMIYYEDDPLNENIEENLIRQQLIKKCKNNFDMSYEEKRKIVAYMYRKGFSIDKVERVLLDITSDLI